MFEHLTSVQETLADGDPTSGASVSGAGTPTPFLRSLPTFGTNRLGFGAETPTLGAEACKLEFWQRVLGEFTFTLELCADATASNAGIHAKAKIADLGANGMF
jgi:hypothetical protein